MHNMGKGVVADKLEDSVVTVTLVVSARDAASVPRELNVAEAVGVVAWVGRVGYWKL